jgi:hypothetical protein
MKVYAQFRRKVSNCSRRRWQHLRDCRISPKHICKSIFRHHGDLDIRPRVIQQFNRRCAKNAIAQRTQTDDRNARLAGQLFDDIGLSRHALFVNYGFIDQHDWNIVTNRVEAMAGNAAQTAPIGLEFNFGPARRTNQNFEQIGTDRHV